MNRPPLLSHLSPIHPPSSLLSKVIQNVESARVRILYTRIAFVLLSLVSIATYISVESAHIWADLTTSSFGAFLHLVFSDPDIMFTNAQDTLLALLESVPTDAVLSLLASSLLIMGLASLLQTLYTTRRHPLPSLIIQTS